MSSCTRTSTSVRSSPPRALYFFVRLYSANLQGLPIMLLVLAPQGFVLLRTSVRCASQRPLCGASLQRLCASVYWTSSKSFVRCEPTKALCFGVLYELQELCAVRAYKGFIQCAPGLELLCTVRAPRALRGASLQRLCASVYCTSAKSLARCEPTKALCLCVLYEPHEHCAVRAFKGFIQTACTVRASRALCRASLQRLCASVCCTSPTSFFRCEPTKTLQCAPGLVLLALYKPHELCAVRAYKDFIQCALYEPHELCAVRAYKGFIQCAGVRPPSFAPSAYVPVRSYEQMRSCTGTCTYALFHMYCTSSHVICGSVREPLCLYVAERSIHVELVRLRVFCEHPQSRTI